MSLFIRTLSDTTITIDMTPGMEVGDIYEIAGLDLRAEVLTFQGEDLDDLDVEIADTGICSETTLGVRLRNGPAFFEAIDDDKSGVLIIHDYEKMKVYRIVYNQYVIIPFEPPMCRVGDNIFTFDGPMFKQIVTHTVDDEGHQICHHLLPQRKQVHSSDGHPRWFLSKYRYQQSRHRDRRGLHLGRSEPQP